MAPCSAHTVSGVAAPALTGLPGKFVPETGRCRTHLLGVGPRRLGPEVPPSSSLRAVTLAECAEESNKKELPKLFLHERTAVEGVVPAVVWAGWEKTQDARSASIAAL